MPRPRKTPEQTAPSLYQGADGQWHARVTVGRRPDGTPRRRHLQRATKSALREAVRETERSRDAGERRWQTQHDPTLSEWVEHWLQTIVPSVTRPKTQATYRSQMRLHVIPNIGGLRLSDLQPEDCESLYADLLAHGASIHTVSAVHRVLRASLNEAVRRRRLVVNPAAVARPPRRQHVEVDPLSIEESRQVLKAAQATRNPPRWSIALALGLRQGEALGLMWSDLDLDAGTLTVRRSVQRLTWRHGCAPTPQGSITCGSSRGAGCPQRHNGGLQLVEPKTNASRRTIVLPAPLIDELRTYRTLSLRRRVAANPEPLVHPDLVFASASGGLIDPRRDNDEWNTLLIRAGVRRVRLHDARHTAATLLLLQGTDIRTLMAVMGWTEMATAQRYTHAVDDLRRRAAQSMASALWDTGPATGVVR